MDEASTASGKQCYFKSDQLDYSVLEKINLPAFYGIEKSSTIDTMIDNVNFSSLLSGSDMYMNGNVRNVDYMNCESFSTRYSDISNDVNNNNTSNNGNNCNIDTLSETMLRQLETPKLGSCNDYDMMDFNNKMTMMDSNIIRRLSDMGISGTSNKIFDDLFPDYKDDVMGIYNNRLKVYSNSSRAISTSLNRRRNKKIYDGNNFISSNRLNCNGNLKINNRMKFYNYNGYLSTNTTTMTNMNTSLVTNNNINSSMMTSNNSSLTSNNNASLTSNINTSLTSNNNSSLTSSSLYPQHPSYNQIMGNILNIAKDQTGCRMLQRQLDNGDELFISSVLDEVIENIYILMTDPFGNYLCQKLMMVCNNDQLGKIIMGTEKDFITICMNMHGTRAIQKLIEVVNDPKHIIIIKNILNDYVVELINDLNGNHVIQKCLISLNNNDCDFIYKAMNDNCIYLSTHRHGCCVMQRCIDAANNEQRMILIDTISKYTLDLVEDAYGNYVIQYVLRLKNDNINKRIVTLLADNVTELAKQKFSSNVVERCLLFCPLEIRNILISKFLNVPFNILKDLILDPFGNYVIQRVLNVAHSDELTILLDRIQPHLEELKVASAGKRIAAKITKKSNHIIHDDLNKKYHDLSNLIYNQHYNINHKNNLWIN